MSQQLDIFQGLNSPQISAVENFEGPTLIIAGAGSGKTRTLTCRIAHMIDSGVKPWNIMALTFTNKAAREMRERIKSTVPASRLRGIYMGTFHGIFRRLLGEYAALLGFPPQYTIYDSADSQNLIKQIVKELELPDEYYKPRLIASRISLAKNNLMLPDVYASREALLEEDRQMRVPKLFQVYDLYFKRCKAAGAMDFDDILLYMNILLRDQPQVTDALSRQFKYILVDEYQDTNSAQYLILKRLASTHGNLCVVGDDSQSIYSFRGAKIENILRFQKDYSNAKVVKLEQNYRSTSNIVEAANSLIEHNSRKLEKKLFSTGGCGDKIQVRCCFNDRAEADEIVRNIQSMLYKGSTPDHFAILYRTNSQSRVFEDALRHRNIPYKIYGGQSFYQRAEVKDLLAYLKLAVNPLDDQALLRIINFPARGIGDTSMSRITDAASKEGCSIFEILSTKKPDQIGIRGQAVKGIENFMAIFEALKEALHEKDAYEFAVEVATRSGITQHFAQSKLIEDVSRLENVEELLNSIKEYVENFEPATDDEGNETGSPTIGGWLSEVSLLTDQDESDDDTPRVTMLTVHASKGLEFKNTYIVGLEENLFPSNRAGSDEEIEEERRIFYVALTRAEERVMLSFAQSRFRYGETVDCLPSRFIREINPDYLEGDMDMAVAGGGRSFKTAAKESSDERTPTKQSWGGYRRKNAGASDVSRDDHARSQSRGTIAERLANSASGAASAVVPVGATSMGSATSLPRQTIDKTGDISQGTHIEHDRFGRGTVTAIETVGNDVRLTIDFDAHGQKVLLQKFAKLRII